MRGLPTLCSLCLLKASQIGECSGSVWDDSVATIPQSLISERAVEAFDKRANLAIPDFENVGVSLIVALAGQRYAIILRHGHHQLAAVEHHLVFRTKSDFLGVNATKYGRSHILKKTLLSLIDTG